MDRLDRKQLTDFALAALSKLKNPRTYALNAQSKTDLACLAAALKRDRQARNLADKDEPTAESQMTALLERLAKTGVNLVQQRPEGNEPKPIPQPWRHPITNEILPTPTTPDERGILATHDPRLLELLDEMQARPYQTVQKLRDDAAKRRELAAVPYTGTEHLANPWRTNDRRMQDELVRRSPPKVVAFYKREAVDVSVPLFGQARNLTIAGRLARGDSDTWTLIQSAQRIHEEWREKDKAAAEEKRAAAEAELRKLQAA